MRSLRLIMSEDDTWSGDPIYETVTLDLDALQFGPSKAEMLVYAVEHLGARLSRACQRIEIKGADE